MFNVRCMFQPYIKGVIADFTVTSAASELELGGFIASFAETAMKTPNVKAVSRMIDHQTGKVSLSGPASWENLRKILIQKTDPTTENIPLPLPSYITGRVEAIAFSDEHVYIEITLNYRGSWGTRPAVAWTN